MGAGFSAGWNNPADIISMNASAGGSMITTRKASGTGSQYFRITRNSTTEMSPSGSCTPGGDVNISTSSSAEIFIANSGPCNNGAWYINAVNTTDNYVFKVPANNSSLSFVYFRIQGTVRNADSVGQSPAINNVYPGQDVTVTAAMDGNLATGQAVYLRYSDDNFSTSTVTQMSGSGTSYSAIIPGTIHAAGVAVEYYVFTSGTANVQSDGSNADYFTINLQNNGGLNYSYTVINGWATASNGNWSNPATWAANAVPPASGMGTVQISNDVTLDQNAGMTNLNLNSGTLSLSGANTFIVSGTATVASGATLNNSSSIANNVSINNLVLNSNGNYIHNTVGSSANGASSDFPGTTRSFAATSNVTINKWANGGTAPAPLPASGNPGWGNLTIDVASLGGMWHQYGSITNIQGDLHIISSGGGGREFRLFSENASGSITIDGNVLVDGGRLSLMNGGTCSFCFRTINCYIKGNTTVNGGIFYLTGTNGFNGIIHTINVYLSGNLTINSPGKLSQLKDVNCIVGVFFSNDVGSQTIRSYYGGIDQAYIGFGIGKTDGSTNNSVYLDTDFDITNITTSSIFRVYNNATLEIPAENKLSGNTAFTLYSGGTLKIGSKDGITGSSALIGNIQTTAGRTYNPGAHYIYNGTYNQVTGNGLPSTITGSLTVDNSGGANDNIVSLTKSNTETKALYLKQGYFAAGTSQTLKISNMGIVDGTGGGDCVYASANGGNIHLRGNNSVTGFASGHPFFYDVTIGDNIASSPSTFSNNGTIYHYCTINTQGSVNPDAPTYATGSTLIYNPGGTYDRRIEWGNTAGMPGYPWHVTVQNATTLNLGTYSVSPNELELGGDLRIGTSSSSGNTVILNNNLAKPLSIRGNLYIGDLTSSNNTLGLSNTIGGDLWLYGNFNRYTNNNYYTDNNRAIYFKGSANCTVNTPSASGQQFSYCLIDKDIGTETITLNTAVSITQNISFNKGIVNTGLTNLLTVTNTATGSVTGGSILSFVNGPMRRFTSTTTAGAYAYPLGKSGTPGRYKPITLTTVNNLASGSDFTGQYFYADPPIAGSDAFLTNLVGIQKNEYWQLDRNTGSTTGKITLPYVNPGVGFWRDAAGTSNYPCATCNVGVVKRNATTGSSTWDFTAATTTLSSAGSPPELMAYTNSGDVISREVTSFSPFTLGFYYDVILPVKLVSFTGKLMGTDALLQWKIANGQDVRHMALERSSDGSSFQQLAKFERASNDRYSYIDGNLRTGTHFYRLAITNPSGELTYSQVVVLSVGSNQTRIIGLQQNPVANHLTLRVVSATIQPLNLTITDVLGRKLTTNRYQLTGGLNALSLQLVPLNPGIYFLSALTGDGVSAIIKFVKQ